MILKIIRYFPDVLTKSLALTNLIEYQIQLKDGIPVKNLPYQLAYPKIEYLREHIKDLVNSGVVEPRPHLFFWFSIPKRKLGLTIALNRHIVTEQCRDLIRQSFHWFVGAKYFYLNSAYHRIP